MKLNERIKDKKLTFWRLSIGAKILLIISIPLIITFKFGFYLLKYTYDSFVNFMIYLLKIDKEIDNYLKLK